ncbi:hypothetical protein DFAR_120002 [Desulfarculales bacterium]
MAQFLKLAKNYFWQAPKEKSHGSTTEMVFSDIQKKQRRADPRKEHHAHRTSPRPHFSGA